MPNSLKAQLQISEDQVRRTIDPESLGFESTDDLDGLDEPLGQERALSALRLSAQMKRPGYNTFAHGPAGVGRHSTVLSFLKGEKAKDKGPTPEDWVYVFRFSDPSRPRALRLPAGRGVHLQMDLNRLVEDLTQAIPSALSSEEFQSRKKAIEEEVKATHAEAIAGIEKDAEAKGVGIIKGPDGLIFVPTQNGKPIPPDEFNKMPEANRQRFEKDIEEFHERLHALLDVLPRSELILRRRMRELVRELIARVVNQGVEEVRRRFSEISEVMVHLDELAQDIHENTDLFLQAHKSGPSQKGEALQLGHADPLHRYRVNVLVSHPEGSGRPIVYETNPTQPNLMGRMEHVSVHGALVTDFLLTKAGALHRANGGTLVLDARKVLMNPLSWEELKRSLFSRKIDIQNVGQALSIVSTASLEPDSIPLDVNVVLLGDAHLYALLSSMDPEFKELFKVPAEFEDALVLNEENLQRFCRFLRTMVDAEKTRPLHKKGAARMAEHAVRLARDSQRLSVHRRAMADLLCEADHQAEKQGAGRITDRHVRDALSLREALADRTRDRLHEEIEKGTHFIDVKGDEVGQINGLMVLRVGDFSFGSPARITARTRMGRGQVLDIEREVELGGPIHSKGVFILQSYVATTFSREVPLSLFASLVFEQSYSPVEGDSASLAELCALLSSLAELPIRQHFAVTGSVNQLGEIQPVGGINEKVEGFFNVCSALGITGNQGVILPRANLRHLMLNENVTAAVKSGDFSIWAVDHVDEALELLMDFPAGKRGPDGHFPQETINGKVERALDEMALSAHRYATQKVIFPPTQSPILTTPTSTHTPTTPSGGKNDGGSGS
jgi:lon-related putative ATP-dependent protease